MAAEIIGSAWAAIWEAGVWEPGVWAAGAAPPPDPEPAPSTPLLFRSTPRLFGPRKVATVA